MRMWLERFDQEQMRGVPFRVIPARGPVLDLSRRADAADVERRLAGVEARP